MLILTNMPVRDEGTESPGHPGLRSISQPYKIAGNMSSKTVNLVAELNRVK